MELINSIIQAFAIFSAAEFAAIATIIAACIAAVSIIKANRQSIEDTNKDRTLSIFMEQAISVTGYLNNDYHRYYMKNRKAEYNFMCEGTHSCVQRTRTAIHNYLVYHKDTDHVNCMDMYYFALNEVFDFLTSYLTLEQNKVKETALHYNNAMDDIVKVLAPHLIKSTTISTRRLKNWEGKEFKVDSDITKNLKKDNNEGPTVSNF